MSFDTHSSGTWIEFHYEFYIIINIVMYLQIVKKQPKTPPDKQKELWHTYFNVTVQILV